MSSRGYLNSPWPAEDAGPARLQVPRGVAGSGSGLALRAGERRFLHQTINVGVNCTANRLIRVSLDNACEHQTIGVSGLAGGSITNPPLVDVRRRIVVAYDSANRVLRAWRFERENPALTPLWHKSPFGCANQPLLYPDTAELVVNDYRHHGEEGVLLQIETGAELGRVRNGANMQGVVFPSPGWRRDLYWSSMGRLARIFVQ